MSLKRQTQTALAGLSAGGPYTLSLREGGRRLTCELSHVDALACAFSHLTLSTGALAGASTEQLQAISERLSKRLTYLLEPISPIETDAEGCVVQMRSNPPRRDEDGSQYYELLVRRGGELSLRRWKKAPGAAREPLEAQVTREVFLRLVGDLSEAV